MRQKFLYSLSSIGGVIYGTVFIFGAGALVIPPFTLILLCRLFGLHVLANRLGTWAARRTTKFTF